MRVAVNVAKLTGCTYQGTPLNLNITITRDAGKIETTRGSSTLVQRGAPTVSKTNYSKTQTGVISGVSNLTLDHNATIVRSETSETLSK